ncbi:MAG: hypothetical protein FJ096_05005 [Deltaproteobacteria bacterium]|nr:hypothetical protein [Deltaproteobacteria bacterium]
MLRKALPLVASSALLVACSGTDETATSTTTATTSDSTATGGMGGSGGSAMGTGGGDATGGSGGASDAGLGTYCVPETVTTTTLGAGAYLIETQHYALRAETDQATAEDLARLLEASWEGFSEYFEDAPALAANERMDVRYFATFENWSAAISADGGAVPQNAGGLFLTSTRRAYLYDQKNPYFNQVLLVHEAAHQFHLLGRASGRSLPFWYVEGIAEHLSRHDWDGSCARLGRVPLMNWSDLPEEALADAQDGGIDVTALTSGNGTPTRTASWALVDYLETGAPLPVRDGFHAFRKAYDMGDTDPMATFASLVGTPGSLESPIAAWLPTAQQPIRPIFLEWLHRGPTSVLAFSPVYFSLAVVKDASTHLEVTYEIPEAATWRVGVVLGFDDTKSYKAVVVGQDGALSSFTATNGMAFWNAAGNAPAKLDAKHGSIAVDLEGGGKVKLTVNGVASTHDTVFTPKVGLAMSDTRVTFRDLAWQ